MSIQADIFAENEEAVYCFDTCSFLNVLKISDDEPYAMDVMPGMLEYIEQKLVSGKIICPKAVYNELKKHEDKVPGLKNWLKRFKHCFRDLDSEQIKLMRPIVNKYEIYTTDKGDYGDLAVIAFAKRYKLVVVTSEVRKDQHKKLHPKIPNVCDELEVDCLSVVGFLRAENVTLTLMKK